MSVPEQIPVDQFTQGDLIAELQGRGIDVLVDGEVLDLATSRVKSFRRVLHMKEGYLERSFTVTLVSGKEVKVSPTRFCSMHRKEVGAIRYAITPLNFDGIIKIKPYLDGDVVNEGAAP